jgi:hypothetical protein
MSVTKFHVGDRVEDKKTHERGRVTFVYSELERKGEVIEVLFDGRDEAVDVSVDNVRKVSNEAGRMTYLRGTGCLSRNAGNGR